MATVIVYWNATKFTAYQNIKKEERRLRLHEMYFQLILPNGNELIVPWNTINHIEVIDEDS